MSDKELIDSGAHKGIASLCNNAAWDLIEKPELSLDEGLALSRLAGTAAYHWNQVGTAGDKAHADLLLSWALARVGAAETAVHASSRALQHFSENEAQDWEKAFAHAAMAISLHCSGDHTGHRRHYASAQELKRKLAPGELEQFQAAFRNVPRP